MVNYSTERTRKRWSTLRALILAVCAVFVPAGGRGGLAEDLPLRLTIKAGAASDILLLAFSPDSKTLAFADKWAVIFWDMVENKRLVILKNRQPWFMAFSPDGGTLALGEDGGILLWDVVAGKRRDLIGQDVLKSAPSVTFAPDGKTLAIAGAGKDTSSQKIVRKIIFWDLIRREERAKNSGYPKGPGVVVFAPDLKSLAFVFRSPSEDIVTSIVDLERLLGAKRRAVSPSEKYLIDGELLCFGPDGKILACKEWPGPKINLWDVKAKKRIAVIEDGLIGDTIRKAAFSPDSRMLALMDDEGQIRLWEIASRKKRAILHGGERVLEPYYDVPFAFSPDGQMFAVRCRDGTIKVWDLARVDRKPPDEAETARLWALLADEDAAVAYRAIRTLTAFPTHVLPLLRKQFHPSQNSEDQSRKIDRLLEDLNSDDFGIRQKAYKELEHVGWRAEEALQRMLAERPSLEVRRRVSALLEHIEHQGAVESIQELRGLEVLEHIGTEEARDLLKDIARGVPEARLRQEAKASLARLAKRPIPKP